MWELRLILILIGAVIITGVYLFSRQNRKRGETNSGQSGGFRRKSPVLNRSGDNEQALDDLPLPERGAPKLMPEAPSDSETTTPGKQQLILALHVAAREDAHFQGSRVVEALGERGLRFGQYRIFHRLYKNDSNLSVFSIANMVEPGAFNLDALPGQTLPGLTLFLVLPGPQDGVDAYADMLATARYLAQELGGEVLDETRSTLTRQTAHHIRERIIDFQRRKQLRQRS